MDLLHSLWPVTSERQAMILNSPQKAVVAKRLLSRGGAHLAQIPWQAGYETPCITRCKVIIEMYTVCNKKCRKLSWHKKKVQHLYKALKYPDNDNAAEVHPGCCRDEHIQARCCHYSEAEHSEGEKERQNSWNHSVYVVQSPDDEQTCWLQTFGRWTPQVFGSLYIPRRRSHGSFPLFLDPSRTVLSVGMVT